MTFCRVSVLRYPSSTDRTKIQKVGSGVLVNASGDTFERRQRRRMARLAQEGKASTMVAAGYEERRLLCMWCGMEQFLEVGVALAKSKADAALLIIFQPFAAVRGFLTLAFIIQHSTYTRCGGLQHQPCLSNASRPYEHLKALL